MTMWMVQAPVLRGKSQHRSHSRESSTWDSRAHIPLALTQLALRFGSVDWSFSCSMGSSGSW